MLQECPDEIVKCSTPFHTNATVASSPGAEVSVLSFTVPVGVTRELETLRVASSAPGCYVLEAGGSEIAAGFLHETTYNNEFKFEPPLPITSGTTVELKYEADSSPTVSCPIKGFIMACDK